MKINKQNFQDGKILTASQLNTIENNLYEVAFNSVKYDKVNNRIIFYSGNEAICAIPMTLGNIPESMKVLFVGNSYSGNTSTYMYDFLTSLGVKNVDISYLYIGSCTINTHWTNAQGDLAKYQYYKWNGETSLIPKTIAGSGTYKMSTGITEQDWDWIIFSQGSTESGVASSYSNLQNLINYVKGLVTSSNTKYAFNMTWAYDGACDRYPTYYADQITMHNQTVSCMKEKVLTSPDISLLIPVGTAIQNARLYRGDTFAYDQRHLDADGCFIASLTACFALLGYYGNTFDVNNYDINKFLPDSEYACLYVSTPKQYDTLNVVDANLFYIATRDAVNNPLELSYPSGVWYILNNAAPAFHNSETLCQSDTQSYVSTSFPPSGGYINKAGTNVPNYTEFSKKFATTIMFTPETLPVGSKISIASGWQFRLNKWSSADSYGTRETATSTGFTINEAFWDNCKFVAFNISKEGQVELTTSERMAINNGEIFIVELA